MDGRPGWYADAACRGSNPLWWTAAHVGSSEGHKAKGVCAGCPVQQDCLDYALENKEPTGIWGGLGVKERERLRRASA